MNRFGLTFHHLGLAVRRPEDAASFLEGLGYTPGQTVFDPEQGVHLAMWRGAAGMPDVEVIWPGDQPGPVDNLLSKRGPSVYHVCYEADDAEAALAGMEAAGVRVLPLGPPRPAILFGGRRVSFYNVVGFGVIELIHAG